MFLALLTAHLTLSPQPLTFPPLNDPFHQQPQQRQQDEGQGGGDQDVKSLVFQPRHGVLVEGSEEGRRGRGKEEICEEGRGRFKVALPGANFFGDGSEVCPFVNKIFSHHPRP